MEKVLKMMLNVQKEMVSEMEATEADLVIISYVLEETTYILQDLISQCKFEEAKGFLDDCSKLQQKQEELEILLSNKRGDYSALECMIEQAKRLVAKPKMCDPECEEEATSSVDDVLAALAFLAMK